MNVTGLSYCVEKDSSEQYFLEFYYNNKLTIELSKFKAQYQEIIGLLVDAENDKKLEDKPEVSITYSLNKGSKKQEIVDFVPYNDQFYAVFRDGKSDFVIGKDKVNKMITGLRNLKGE